MVVKKTLRMVRGWFPFRSQPHLRPAHPLRKAQKEFVGKVIKDGDGRHVGTVVELMIDIAGSRVTYSVVSLTGTDGSATGFYSVLPWGVLHRAPLNNHVVSTASSKQLSKAPRFRPDRWPDMSDSKWSAGVYRACDKRPYWYFVRPLGPPNVRKLSGLIGIDVRNSREDDLGIIHEFVIEVIEGRIVYAVLSAESPLGLEKKLFAIPCDRLSDDASALRLSIDIDKEELRNSAGIDKDCWPTTAQFDGTMLMPSRGNGCVDGDLEP